MKNQIDLIKYGRKIARITGKLKHFDMCSANEIITMLYNEDIRRHGADFLIEKRGWRYFNHLNKLFAPMEKAGFIEFTGLYTKGESGKREKLWRLCK
jgi:hypothetical protein